MLMCSSALGIASCGGGGDNNTSSNKDSSNSTQCSSSQYLENSQCKDKISQSIIYFNLPESLAVGGYYSLYAKLSSDLNANFISKTPEICTITDQERVQTIAEGVCIVEASQKGDHKFLAAQSVTQEITVNPKSLLGQTGITLCANQNLNAIPCHLIETLGDFFGLWQDGETKVGKELSYTLLNNNDSECIKDNVTGLIWEKKTNDGTLRDKKWVYSWYNSDQRQNGGVIGIKDISEYYRDTDNKLVRQGYLTMYTGEQKKDGNSCGYTLDKCNTQDYVNELNKQKYCGYSDWYVPTRAEINTILHFDEESFVDPIFEMGEKYWTNTTNLGTKNEWVRTFDRDYVSGRSGWKLRDSYPVRAVRSN